MIQPCKDKQLGDKVYRCYFELTLQVMGGKWKPVILYHLAVEGVMRFSDLRRSINGVTERMLARQLRELEADRIVNRKVYREVPPRVEYSLTEMGQGLIPILKELRDWGAVYEQRMGGADLFAGEGYERPESGRKVSGA